METQYKVVVPCIVHVPISAATGPELGTLYARDILPAAVPEKKIKFLLDGGMIAPVDEDGSLPPAEKAKATGPAEPPVAGAEVKMPPENGPGSGKDAWVDYAVASGALSREDAESMSKGDLVKALKGE